VLAWCHQHWFEHNPQSCTCHTTSCVWGNKTIMLGQVKECPLHAAHLCIHGYRGSQGDCHAAQCALSHHSRPARSMTRCTAAQNMQRRLCYLFIRATRSCIYRKLHPCNPPERVRPDILTGNTCSLILRRMHPIGATIICLPSALRA
jgi:hypothetical protein